MRYKKISRELFVLNRKRFADRLGPKNSIAIFNACDVMPTSGDGVLPFVQNSDLFYLAGIDQEETMLLLFPGAKKKKNREILFVKKTDETLSLWEGHKLSQKEAKEISGIESVFWTDEFDYVFRQLVVMADKIYLNTNEHGRAENFVETRDMRFIKKCRDLFPLHTYRRSAPIMKDLRIIKSGYETELIKKACNITGKAFMRVLGFICPGVYEFEIQAEINHEFFINRSKRPAYESIIASGADACILHYVQNDKKCRGGDLVLMDFGAEYAGYASDLTRTVPVNGKYGKRQKEVYNAVYRLQKAAIAMCVPGSTLEACQKNVVELVEKELVDLGLISIKDIRKQTEDMPEYKKYFMHGVSHYMGLDVHDLGDRDMKFEPGMVLTCEPGIYIKEEGIGVRIENDILITKNKPVDLTENIPVRAEEIEEIMSKK